MIINHAHAFTRSPLTIEYLTPYLRENTGRVLTDSGDAYGRQYNRPIPDRPAWFDAWQPPDQDELAVVTTTMSLGHFLIETCEALPQLQSLFDDFAAESKNDWEEDLEAFFAQTSFDDGTNGGLGYALHGKGGYYTYNWENDFDQDFQFWLFISESTVSTDIPSNVVVLRSHNGCDARWGFSRPLFLTVPGKEYDLDSFPRLHCNTRIKNWEDFPEISEGTRDGIEEYWQHEGAFVEVLHSLGFTFQDLSDHDQTANFREDSTGKILSLGIEIPFS
jgi:hypothetical protein